MNNNSLGLVVTLTPQQKEWQIELNVTDHFGRKSCTSVSPEVSVGHAMKVAVDAHCQMLVREMTKEYSFPLKGSR